MKGNRVNIYLTSETWQALRAHKDKLAKDNLDFKVSAICERAIREALGLKAKH
jgi:hypothetical protein